MLNTGIMGFFKKICRRSPLCSAKSEPVRSSAVGERGMTVTLPDIS